MREQAKHTPGPWKELNGFIFSGRAMLFAAPTVEECSSGCSIHPESKEHKANAILATAAPELLEALKELLECSPCKNGCDPDDMTCANNKAIAAINRAEGK
jgi:hypothetical protein